MTQLPFDGEIRAGRHHMQVRIFFEDTDFSSAVYHANYLRFMERGRTNYLRLLGTDQRSLFEETQEGARASFVVRSMTIDFFKAAFMDDLLKIITMPKEASAADSSIVAWSRRLKAAARFPNIFCPSTTWSN